MERVSVCAFVIVLLSVEVYSTNNSYVILAPKTFRPGMLVNMSILILKEDIPGTPVDVNATFLINSVLISSAVGRFHAGVLDFLPMQIPFSGFLEKSTGYRAKKRLQVVGSGGLTFNTSETQEIVFNKKGFSIYIQTDKGIYKPKQTVHMRILAVYPDLKVHTGKMTIGITDPHNIKLALWKDVATASGVVTQEFELSSQPRLGVWKISVKVEGRKETKTFEVGEYVLPKFKVDVLTNSYASFGNGEIRGSVSAKYTYGKGVRGLAKLWLQFPCYRYSPSCRKTLPHKEFKIDGNHSFSIPEAEVTDLFQRHFENGNPYKWYYSVTVNVSVTEDLTGKTYFGTTKVILTKSDIVLSYANANPKAFKPNFMFQVLFKVSRPDNTPVINQKIPVRIRTITTPMSLEKADWISYTTNQNGYVGVYLNISSNVRSVRIEAEAVAKNGEKVTSRRYLPKFTSQSNSFLTLTAEKYELEAGEDIVCNATTTDSVSFLYYMILSRGNIVVSNSVSYSREVQSATLKIPTSSIMSPYANVIVYFVRDDGEIVADSLKIKVNGAFENVVSVRFSTAVSKPGQDVNVTVKASPYSQVGLLAVDKSVLLLKKDNDFSVEQVMRELDSYGASSPWYFPFFLRSRNRRSFRYIPWYPSGTNVRDIFMNAGVTVITDCVSFTKRTRWRAFFPFQTRISKTGAGPVPTLASVETVRSFFPETWLWKNVITNSFGHAQVSTKSPDTITSWVLSGFAVSNVTGFGVANEKPQLRVFQPFFLSMDLPYSVVRGEEVAIKVVVFNYEKADMKVYVTLKGSPDWENINRSTNVRERQAVYGDVVSIIKVPANSGTTVSFPVIPAKLGNIPITITAQSNTSADAVRRNLLVEPEGIEQDYSYSMLLDLNASATLNKELVLEVPENVVKDSAKAMISVIGDIMGSSISGIEKLLKMPYGCGEQNMVNFAPSMFIRTYLENVGQLTPSVREKSIRFMTLGYQRELTYQHRDGSYSAFGEKYGRKRPGSLWLTAFVVKSFSRAKRYIYIDPESLYKSVVFMLSRQQEDGSFKESGTVSSYLQGGLKSENPEALTAYVLVSLMEYSDKRTNVQQGISAGLQFLKNNLEKINDSYTLAIMAYAMELANDEMKQIVLTELMKKSVREGGTLHWTDAAEKKQRQPWFRPYYRPRSADIEITSYALLVYAHRREKENGLLIARWLAQQRNSLGGYSSTQDTVIGLQGLSEFAPLIFSPDLNFTVNVKLSADPNFSKSFQVDRTNMVVLQRIELPTVHGRILISGNGKGIGMLQVGVTYNVDKPPTDRSFNLVVRVIEADNRTVKTRSCMTYAGDGQKSGMAILEFGLPSGFNIDQDDVNKILSDKNTKIKRIETPGRKAVLYFDEILKTKELCVNLTSIRTHSVGKARPIPVVVYDYYKPEKRAVTMYSTGKGVDLCDVCSDCTSCERLVVEPCDRRRGCLTTSGLPRDLGVRGTATSSQISYAQYLVAALATVLFVF